MNSRRSRRERGSVSIELALITPVLLVLMLVGGIWMIGQVLADQSGGPEEKRYRDVER